MQPAHNDIVRVQKRLQRRTTRHRGGALFGRPEPAPASRTSASAVRRRAANSPGAATRKHAAAHDANAANANDARPTDAADVPGRPDAAVRFSGHAAAARNAQHAVSDGLPANGPNAAYGAHGIPSDGPDGPDAANVFCGYYESGDDETTDAAGADGCGRNCASASSACAAAATSSATTEGLSFFGSKCWYSNETEKHYFKISA